MYISRASLSRYIALLGAKLANIYSKEFVVETNDGKRSFRQRHWSNMSRLGKAIVKDVKTKAVSFMS